MQHSIVTFGEIIKTADIRVDAEYWHPDYISNFKLLSPANTVASVVEAKIANIKSAPIFQGFEYLEISKISLTNGEYDTSYIEPGHEPDRAHHILKKDDVAVSTVRPNRNAVAYVKKSNIIGSSGLSVLRARNIKPEYLFAFCKTEYFIKCLMRADKATMYPAVAPEDVLSTPIYIPSEEFEGAITANVRKAISNHHAAKQCYAKAQKMVISEMNLVDWQPRHRLAFVADYSGIEQSDRFDADYFQPKYDEIANAVMNYKGGWGVADDLLSIKSENFTPIESELYQYIELANIGNTGEVASCMLAEGENLPTRARRQVASGDVIVSSIEGSLSSIALINNQYDRALCSTGFHVVNSALLNSETLLVLLKSVIGQLQLKKGCNGTILTGISKDEFGKMVLPKIQNRMQAKIQEKISESFRLREQSEHLLECAKRAVEIAIEQNEKTALDWLKTATSNTAN